MSRAVQELRATEVRGPARLPTVSVVIPTRDRPDWLRRCVAAVLDQDYAGDIECVVVFDRSDPLLPDLPTSARRRLRACVNDRTPGLAGARNTGALAATGELLAFCDDDDEWLPRKLSLQVPALLEHPEAVAVSSGIFIRRGERLYRRVLAEPEVSMRDLLRDRIMEVNPCNIVIPRRAFVQDAGLVDEAIPGSHGEDYEWLLRATRRGPIVVVPDPLVVINWHDASWFSAHWETMAAALMYLLERHPEFGTEPSGLARVRGQIAFYRAAAGHRSDALRWAGRSIAANPFERRAYLAAAVALRLASAPWILRTARRTGRGI